MLTNRLKASSLAAPQVSLTYVGGASGSGSSATPSLSLTSLTGGIASSPSAGDIVIACFGYNGGTDIDIEVTTSGYTEIADLYGSNTSSNGLGVFYKVLSSAETSVDFSGGGVNNGYCVHVWRNIDSTPLDATPTTSVVTTTSRFTDAPAITTTTSNAVVIAIGSVSGTTTGSSGILALTVPSGMTNFVQNGVQSGANRVSVAMASALVASPSTYDPAQFGGGSRFATTAIASCTATVALRKLQV
jgi:hypothetical protein